MQAAQPLPTECASATLPSIAPNSPAWTAFKRTPETRLAYTTQLKASIATIQQFVREHANGGIERQQALDNLDRFLQTRVNCNANALSHLVINESRRNLNLFAQQLNNPHIPADKKLSCALSLAQGLGVCNEGETLNILECTQHLCSQQSGLAGVLNRTKNSLVEQHLQELVKQEDKPRLNENRAQELEIHHVQALKNFLAEQWGLSIAEDRYATANYQAQAGKMADELLRQTITPCLLANTVAEQIAQAFCSHSNNGLSEGMATDRFKTEPLRRAIEAEFGQEIELEQCLEFNNDYSMVRLKPQRDIALHVLHNCQKIGLIHPHANLDVLLQETTANLKDCIEKVGALRGAVAHRPATFCFLPNFWVGYSTLPTPETKRHTQEN